MRINHELKSKKNTCGYDSESSDFKKKKKEDKSNIENSSECKIIERSKCVFLKTNNTIACKMKQVVEKLIQRHKKNECLNNITIFIYKSQQSEIITSFLQEIKQENKSLFENKQHLLKAIEKKYNELIM